MMILESGFFASEKGTDRFAIEMTYGTEWEDREIEREREIYFVITNRLY